jgi:peptidoglycan hydrolase-like protein with peptidoglycan-binding domain
MKLFARVFLFLLLAGTFLHADSLILAAQKKLKQKGFYAGDVDGRMGSQTAAGIRRYQLAENLKITGALNPQTLQSLGLANTLSAKPGPEYVALAAIFKGGPYISIGPEGQIATIRQAQKNLKVLGYYHGPVDGAPSTSLVAALKAWQKSADFRQSGRFDENTLKGLSLMPN